MCGLIGMASTERLKNATARKKIIEEGLMVNSVRGDHSTGFAAFPIGTEDKDYVLFKKAYNGADFVGFPRFKSVMQDIEKYSCFIGHNRAATTAPVNHQNAHPFDFGHIVLAHNGHINNAHSLLPNGTSCPIYVDSAQLAMAMSLIGEKEALERAQGGFALTWFNTKDKTLNFARNSLRPLKFVYVKGENTMFWASERQMLVWLMSRDDRYKQLEIDGKFKNVKDSVWYKFKMDDLRGYQTENFQYRPGRKDTGRQSNANTGPSTSGTDTEKTAGNSDGSSKPPETESKTNTTSGPVRAFQSSSTGGKWDLDAYTAHSMASVIPDILKDLKFDEKEAVKRDGIFRKNSGRPSRKKGVDSMRRTLSNVGFKFDEHVLFSPQSFLYYKNQDKLGKAVGVLHNTGILCDVCNISHTQYIDMQKQNVVLCRVVNITTGISKAHRILILEVDGRYPEFNLEWSKRRDEMLGLRKRRASTGNTPNASANNTSNGDVTEGQSVTFLFPGPAGKMITEQKYGELIRRGCSFCSGDLPTNPKVAAGIIWIDNDPICPSCVSSPATRDELQIKLPHNILH